MINNVFYKKLYRSNMKKFLRYRNDDSINISPNEFDRMLTKFIINLDKADRDNCNLERISNDLNK